MNNDIWADEMDELGKLRREHLTLDQKIQLFQAAAMLSVSQQLSAIHHAGIAAYDAGS